MAKKLSVPVFRFYGGKGGVGKTTCAAPAAIASADSGRRTLVISTDPAPSLGDAFRARLSASPRRVADRLQAVEIDAHAALDRWLSARREALERIVLRGTWLDQEDVTRLLRLSLPGIDELAALLEISRFGRSGKYDLIVVDTAPTGHTLRMLSMPETLLAVSRVFDHMQAKHRVMVEALRGAWRPEADDVLIAEMAQEARELSELLRDPARVAMSWVTLAEPMAVEETIDAATTLAARGITLAEVVVNRVTPKPPSACRWCSARRAFEAGALADLQQRVRAWAAPPVLRIVEAQDREPTGLPALRKVARNGDRETATINGNGDTQLFRRVASKKLSVPVSASRVRVSRATLPAIFRRKPAASWQSRPPGLPPTLLMFGGKGGVGKTTCAAAVAITAAAAQPQRRVLLMSTDPAHSLADALGVSLANEPRALPGGPPNLQVRELDAAAGFARVRDKYYEAIDALFERFTRNSAFDASQDRRVLQDLIDLAPPGIDELAAIIDVTDTLDEATHDADDPASVLLVVDTAPSGHALRLLEMPALVQDWAKALMSILLKYQPVVGVGELGAILLKLSQGIGRLRALLTDPSRTHFIIVTRAAVLPRAETVRLQSALADLGIRVPAVLVNAVGAGTCSRCRRQRTSELREIQSLGSDLRRQKAAAQLIAAPAWMPPPHGASLLTAWARTWRAT